MNILIFYFGFSCIYIFYINTISQETPLKKTGLVILFIIIIYVSLSGTAQFPDILYYKGQKYSIFSNPLESYFSSKNPRPDNLFQYSCTANWRGYIATWKIENGKFLLVKVVKGDCSANPAEIDISSLFGKKLPVEAIWFSGVLRIPQGKLLSYIHMGYGSVYEKDILLTIRNGLLIREEIKTNSVPKIR